MENRVYGKTMELNDIFEARFVRNRSRLLFGLFCLSVLVRFLTAEYVEYGGDCVHLWINIRRVLDGLSFNAWNHHTMRWAINLPLLGVVKLFGPHPQVYYILPTLYASVAAVLFYLIGERLHGPRLGFWTSLLSILYPQMTQTGSQIWPGVFELTYIAACVWLLLVWLDENRLKWLVLAGVAFVLAWASRVTAVYFLPGLVLLIWLPERRFKPVLVFGAVIASLCFVELLYFWADTGNILGRVGVIKSTHGSQTELLVTPAKYLLRAKGFLKLRGLFGVLVASIGACWFAWKGGDRRVRAVAVLFLVHVFLEAYMISGLNPFKVAQPLGTRYHTVAAPYGILLLLLALERLDGRRRRVKTMLLGLLLAAFTFFSFQKIPATLSVLQMTRDNRILSQALAGRSSILVRYTPWEPNWIEARVMRLFGYSGRRKNLGADEVLRFMGKNRARIYALYAPDIRIPVQKVLPEMSKRSKYEYVLSASEREEPHVGVEFGRKAFKAFPLPQ